MIEIHTQRRGYFALSYMAVAVAVAGGICLYSDSAHAEVVAFGDVTPSSDPALPIFGGLADGAITVGVTDVGRLVIDVPAFTAPLISEGSEGADIGATIGEGDAAIGEVVITGLGSAWEVRGSSIIGDEGLGFMSIINGARFVSSDRLNEEGEPVSDSAYLYLGYRGGSSAIVTVSGFGSRMQSNHMMVGREGDGAIDITSRGNMITRGDATIGFSNPSFDPESPFESVTRPTGRVTVNGLGSRWTVLDNLVIGDDRLNTNEQGVGTLQIQNQGLVQVGDYDDNSSFGNEELIVNANGRIELAGGTLRTLTGSSITSQNPIINNGVIKGDGFIDGLMVIGPSGQLRNAAAIANQREQLLISGAVANLGTIESLGGEMEFLAPVVNDFEIIARDAVMRFPAGLANNGTMAVGGDTTIHGAVDFSGGGSLFVLTGSETLMVSDLVFSASSVLGLSVGSAPGTLDIVGAVDLGSATLSLDYAAGIFPKAGDTYQILQASEGITGTFSTATASAGGGLWDITVELNRVLATFTGTAAVPIGADFNGDGIVNSLDMQIWQENYGRTEPPDLAALGDANGDGSVDGRDLMVIQRRWNMPGALTGNLAAVPEPSGLILGLCAAMGMVACRKARPQASRSV